MVATPAFLFGQTYCCGPLRSSSGNQQAEGNQELERATALSGDAEFERIETSPSHIGIFCICEPHLRTAFGAPKTQICAPDGNQRNLVAVRSLGARGCPAMALALKIIGWWMLLSCTLGPCLTWRFFYGERQRKYEQDRRRSIDSTSSRQAAQSN